tara:strand:- start:132 stop:452 length:321 start_codon:yes stop_codon:yes gene_type:complete
MDTVWHLWRRTSSKPYYQWAADVVYDPDAPSFYRVIDYDHVVADTVFLHRLEAHLRHPHRVRWGTEANGGTVEHTRIAQMGEAGHFEEAIRTVPDAPFRQIGRAGK